MGRWRLVLRLLLVAGLGAMAVHRAGPSERTDLPVYLAGAERLLEGDDPLGAESARGWPYIYPPTLAALVAPLTLLPRRAAAAVWFLAGALAFFYGVRACRRALGRTGPPDRWDYAALLLVFAPAASALLRGQVGPLLLGLCGGAILALARRRDVAAGLLVSLATAIKVTPGLFLFGLLVAGRWRACAAAAAGLIVWTLLLPAPFLGLGGAADACARFGRTMVLGAVAEPERLGAPVGETYMRYPTNQSLTAQVVRRVDAKALRTVLLAALAGALLAVCVVASRRAPSPPRFEACALLLAVPLVAAPIVWHHHHVLAYPALLVLVAARRHPAARAALACFLAATVLHFAIYPLRAWSLLGWGTLVVVSALPWSCASSPPPRSSG